MSTAPLPSNQTATVVNSVIDGVFKVAVDAGATTAIAALDSAVPEFAAPVISTLTDDAIQWLAGYIGNAIYQKFALFVTFEIIDIQVGGEVSDVKTALANLKAAQASKDPAAIQTALQAFGQAVGNLTHLDGVANPGNL